MGPFAKASSSHDCACWTRPLGTLLIAAALVAAGAERVGARGSPAAAGDLRDAPPEELAGAATEGVSLLQTPGALLEKGLPDDGGTPHLINLRRESVPIYRRGKVASFKTSYSGVLHVGNPPQDFRVVFDTGSAHVVLPAAECRSESCLVHRRYNMSASSTSLPINTDGSVVPAGDLCDQVTIGFGTGEITGEFVKDTVCFNLPDDYVAKAHAEAAAKASARADAAAAAEAAKAQRQPHAEAQRQGQGQGGAGSEAEGAEAAAEGGAAPEASAGDPIVLSQTDAVLNESAARAAAEAPAGAGAGADAAEGGAGGHEEPAHGGARSAAEAAALAARAEVGHPPGALCVDMHVVLAVEMSTQPFKSFLFDGILGLSLDGLALSDKFSAVDILMGERKVGRPHFGVFLTEGEDGEDNEIAMGGHNPNRVLEPLTWSPVVMADMGYWLVKIVAVRINGQELDVCRDGTCRGVVDTGTSHLGVPAPYDAEVADLLTVPAGQLKDCRLAESPAIEIEVEGYNLTLHSFNYMRRLPLREGVTVGSKQGVYIPSNETNATLEHRSSADAVPLQANATANGSQDVNVSASANATADASANASANRTAEEEAEVRRYCRPRLMPVRLPAPLGPKLFILGEPVLHRYYTVFDWGQPRVAFGLANNRRNTMTAEELAALRKDGGVLPKEVDMLLMQTTTARGRRSPARL
ncbi:unnamed protein product [Prorocentrum cordatum]|uniref:Peptidase A1 domain-containing protein n=1 Tax=Prorocentrum cordatum TaxID=2364126 RepID=A0ABN9URF0_9DINO|nr:unnamed protein product [Polarella glacialis]